MNRRDRYYTYLPLCEDWEIARKDAPTQFAPYRACCQDPRNWHGDGPARDFVGSPEYRAAGFVAVRSVVCGVCDMPVNGHEWVRSVDAGERP